MDIIVFILTLGIIITLHELGHLIAAKIFGVYCREFAIGMGPKLTSFKGKETEYSLRAIPIGGYVAMAGEPDEDDQMPEGLPFERTLPGIHPLKRIVIYLAGIIMNILLFIVAFTIFFSIVGVDNPELTTSTISMVQENSVAHEAGIIVGDKIVEIINDGQSYVINDYKDLQEATMGNTDEITYVIERDGKIESYDLVPEFDESSGRYLVGIGFETPRESLNVIEALGYSINFTWTYTKLIVGALANLFVGKGLDQMGGPIAIFRETSKVVDMGLLPIVAWIGQLSLNVGIFNALPIPALDGGRVLLTLVELITGKPVNKELENRLITISFLLLLGLIAVIMVNDIVGIF